MFEGRSGSYAESDFGRSSQGSTWRERRQKRREDREQEQEEEQSGLGEGSYQTHRKISGTSGRGRCDERDEEIESLRRFVRDLELEARGRCRRKAHGKRADSSTSVGGRYGEGSHQSGSHQH